MQLVDLLDGGALPGRLGYEDLFRHIRRAADEAHMEGRLKAEIISNPDQFVEPDEEIPLTLLDQKKAGKKILLISNSEWSYAGPMLAYAFDRFMPKSSTWRDLFDIVIVGRENPISSPSPCPPSRWLTNRPCCFESTGDPSCPAAFTWARTRGWSSRASG